MEKASADGAEKELAEALDLFRCSKDKDIEKFLRKKAIEFETKGWCTVYLILDANRLQQGEIFIVAYFTLSHKSILFLPKVSKNKRKDLTTNKEAGNSHVVLVGQLGKYINEDEDKNKEIEITSKEILNDAFEVIQKSSNIIICRGVLVECSPEEKIHKVYENYGFKLLQVDGKYHQYYKRV